MPDFRSRKIPVTERQFLWVQDDDKGEVLLHVGPTMVSPTAADRIVIDDGNGGFKEDPSSQPQRMIELSDSQYAVLFNPLLEPDPGYPNGRFKSGRNEPKPLRIGTRIMIPGPCSFWVRPGQRIEIRDAHELASDQYLLVKVYGEVDKSAPFYDLTARSAAITRTTAENVGQQRSTNLADLAPVPLTRGQLIVIRGLDTQIYIPPTGVDIVPDTSLDDTGSAANPNLARQLLSHLSEQKKDEKPKADEPAPLVSPVDLLTAKPEPKAAFAPAPLEPPKVPPPPPPTGAPPPKPAPMPVNMPAPAPSQNIAPTPLRRPPAATMSLDAPQERSRGISNEPAAPLKDMPVGGAPKGTGAAPTKTTKEARAEVYKKAKVEPRTEAREKDRFGGDFDDNIPQEQYEAEEDESLASYYGRADVEQSSRLQRRATPPPVPTLRDKAELIIQESPEDLSEVAANESVRKALEREARQARLVRRAVVLGEKEYCVIVDADGKREIKVGPARVFPGPYDTFMTKGSRKRVYDAYELLPQRALWLRVISQISRAELEKKLPRGFALEKDKDAYYPGDELLLTNVSTFFFPFNEIEVLSPETGEAIVGNDHSKAFVEAIGIDQRSGIYVRDFATGEVKLVQGKRSYLVDPSKEVQITRTIPTEEWNLWVGSQQPHKLRNTPKTVPWALSINVPHNTAVLVTSATGQRVVEGPKMTLLEYEERLTPMLLSTGTPKSDANPLRTCYLRVRGNRVSDVIQVETSDYVHISIRVSYFVTFRQEYKSRWFTHENYVQALVEHLRSLVRGRVRLMSLSALWPRLPFLLRDIILGEKQQDGTRPNRLFQENGMEVTEVEVLASTIEDKAISDLMLKVQTESVVLQLGDRQLQEGLASAKMRDGLSQERHQLSLEAKEREAALNALVKQFSFELASLDTRNAEALARERQRLADERESETLRAKTAREEARKATELALLLQDAEAKAKAARTIDAVELELKAKLSELELALVRYRSSATVEEREAVQRGLIEAMAALGDKALLSEVAQNMNLVSLFKGKDAGQILAEIVGGTSAAKTIDEMTKK